MQKWVSAWVLALALSIGAVGAARSAEAAQPEQGRVVEVRATEYRFTPARIEAKAGERITIRLVNAGTEKHEWESEGLHAEVKPIDPGKTAEVTFVAPPHPGAFEFACHVDDHYEKGMIGFVVVK